jgi:hypothetical protein
MPPAGVNQRGTALGKDLVAEPPQRIRDRLTFFHLDPNAHSCASYG